MTDRQEMVLALASLASTERTALKSVPATTVELAMMEQVVLVTASVLMEPGEPLAKTSALVDLVPTSATAMALVTTSLTALETVFVRTTISLGLAASERLTMMIGALLPALVSTRPVYLAMATASVMMLLTDLEMALETAFVKLVLSPLQVPTLAGSSVLEARPTLALALEPAMMLVLDQLVCAIVMPDTILETMPQMLALWSAPPLPPTFALATVPAMMEMSRSLRRR